MTTDHFAQNPVFFIKITNQIVPGGKDVPATIKIANSMPGKYNRIKKACQKLVRKIFLQCQIWCQCYM